MPNYEFDDDTGSINSDWLNPVGNWTYGPATKTIAKTLTPEDGVKIYPQGIGSGVFIGGTNKPVGYYNDDSILGYGTKFKPTSGVTDGTAGWERDYNGVRTPPMFNAVGDWDGVSGTDNLTAFNEMHASFSPVGTWVGGKCEIIKDEYGGRYYFSDTWVIDKRITVIGTNEGDQVETTASGLIFAANKTGIRVHSSLSSPDTSSGDATRISALNISSASTLTTGHGIHSSARVKIDNVVVRDFAENGVNIVADAVAVTGNANGWNMDDVTCTDNGGDGVFVSGADANAGVGNRISCRSNGGFGIHDDSKLGNTWVACHAAGNTGGSYKTKAVINYPVLISCYVEGGTGSTPSLSESTMVVGGLLALYAQGFIVGTLSGESTLDVQTRLILNRQGTEYGRFESTNVLQGLRGFNANQDPINYSSIDGSLLYIQTSSASNQDLARFRGPSAAVLGSITKNSAASVAYNTTSDYRLKENIILLNPTAIELVKRLVPSSFNFIADKGNTVTGFIAHELQEVLPEAVTGVKDGVMAIGNVIDAKGELIEESVEQRAAKLPDGQIWQKTSDIPDYQGVDNSKVVPLLTAALQEALASIDDLSQRLTALEIK